MSNLVNFMHKLGADAAFSERFKVAPKDVMEMEGLTASEQALVLGGDVSAMELATGCNAKSNPEKTIKSYAR